MLKDLTVKTIGEVTRELGLTLRTARFYEQRGLIAPYRDGPHRLYGPEHVARLSEIRKLTRYGFTLTEIKRGITARDKVRQHGHLRQKIVEFESAAVDLASEIQGMSDG